MGTLMVLNGTMADGKQKRINLFLIQVVSKKRTTQTIQFREKYDAISRA